MDIKNLDKYVEELHEEFSSALLRATRALSDVELAYRKLNQRYSYLSNRIHTEGLGVEAESNPKVFPSSPSNSFELVSASSWFSAFQALRRQGSGKTIELNGQTYVRPFTMKENLQARVEDFNTLTNPDGTQRTEEERRRFSNTWLDSCSSIHNLARTTRFKINPMSPELIALAQVPTQDYLAVPYVSSVLPELDASQGKYNQSLSRAEVLEQPAWLAATEEDRVLLGEAFDVLRTVKNAPAGWKGMGFYPYLDKEQDELRPLVVNCRNWTGDAEGRDQLCYDGRLLRR